MATKRTYQPSKTRRARRHGFLVRSGTRGGRTCCATVVRAVAGGSGSSRGRQALRPRHRPAPHAKSAIRTPAARMAGKKKWLATPSTWRAVMRGVRASAAGDRASMPPGRVERNRIKRCIREAFRLEQDRLGAIDMLVRPPYGVEPSPRMIVRLRSILATLSAA